MKAHVDKKWRKKYPHQHKAKGEKRIEDKQRKELDSAIADDAILRELKEMEARKD